MQFQGTKPLLMLTHIEKMKGHLCPSLALYPHSENFKERPLSLYIHLNFPLTLRFFCPDTLCFQSSLNPIFYWLSHPLRPRIYPTPSSCTLKGDHLRSTLVGGGWSLLRGGQPANIAGESDGGAGDA